MQTKPLYQSKTLWVQLIAVLSILFPAVQEWVAKNPVEITAIFTAVNTLVRFFTQDKIKPFKSEGGINLPVLGILVVGLGFIGLSLTSCTAFQDFKIDSKASYRDPSTGAKAGVSYSGGKLRPWAKVPFIDKEGNVVGEWEVITPDTAK